MISVSVTHDQIEYTTDLINKYNFALRGVADGNKENQFIGMLGQTVFADLLGLPRPQGGNGFDGGCDFHIGSYTTDVKTMGRSVDMKDSYVHNLIALQSQYNTDYYIFMSYNRQNNLMTICGFIRKNTFFERANCFPAGSQRIRNDGTSFTLKADNYEIPQTKLNQINKVSDIIDGITAGI